MSEERGKRSKDKKGTLKTLIILAALTFASHVIGQTLSISRASQETTIVSLKDLGTKSVTVQASPDIVEGEWTNVATFRAPGYGIRFTNLSAGPRLFYRTVPTETFANMQINLNTNSPMSRTIIVTKKVTDVTLGVFDLESSVPSTMSKLQFSVDGPSSSVEVLQNFRLYDGSTLVGSVSSVVSNSESWTIDFSFMTVPFMGETRKSLRLVADVIPPQSTITVTVSIEPRSGIGIDNPYVLSEFFVLPIVQTGKIVANPVTIVNEPLVLNTSVTRGPVQTPVSGVWTSAYIEFGFMIENILGEPIYIHRSEIINLNSSSVDKASIAYVLSGSSTGDTESTFCIPPGGSRTFKVGVMVENTSGTTASVRISVTGVNFGFSPVQTDASITNGLDSLWIVVP